MTAALVNDSDSPLAAACDIVLPIGARTGARRRSLRPGDVPRRWYTSSRNGPEDAAMHAALGDCPNDWPPPRLLDWEASALTLAKAASLVVIGRGRPRRCRERAQAGRRSPTCMPRRSKWRGVSPRTGRPGRRWITLLMFVASDATASGLRDLADAARQGRAPAAPTRQAATPPTSHCCRWTTRTPCAVSQSGFLRDGAAASRASRDRPRPPATLGKVTRTR